MPLALMMIIIPVIFTINTNIILFSVPVYYEQGIVGDRVYLPCDISTAEGPQETEDSAVLVLWYKENSGTPIYRLVYV